MFVFPGYQLWLTVFIILIKKIKKDLKYRCTGAYFADFELLRSWLNQL